MSTELPKLGKPRDESVDRSAHKSSLLGAVSEEGHKCPVFKGHTEAANALLQEVNIVFQRGGICGLSVSTPTRRNRTVVKR